MISALIPIDAWNPSWNFKQSWHFNMTKNTCEKIEKINLNWIIDYLLFYCKWNTSYCFLSYYYLFLLETSSRSLNHLTLEYLQIFNFLLNPPTEIVDRSYILLNRSFSCHPLNINPKKIGWSIFDLCMHLISKRTCCYECNIINFLILKTSYFYHCTAESRIYQFNQALNSKQ